jgi:hypothetical protein
VIDALAAWRQLTPFVPGYQWPGAVPQIGDLYPEMLAYPTQLAPPPDYRYPNPGPLSGELVYPGHGYPPRRGEDRPALSPWGRMAKGGAIGKKTVLLYNAQETGRQSSPVPILTVAGDDLDAQPCVLTLLPPLIIPLPFTGLLSGANLQNLTGEQNNLEQTGNFPGTAEPPLWPPFEAVVEWGIGGASARATVDFANGVVVPNLMASWIRVHAISPVGSAVTGTSAAYVLYAFLGPGPGVGHGRRTVWVGELTAGSESAAFPDPTLRATCHDRRRRRRGHAGDDQRHPAVLAGHRQDVVRGQLRGHGRPAAPIRDPQRSSVRERQEQHGRDGPLRDPLYSGDLTCPLRWSSTGGVHKNCPRPTTRPTTPDPRHRPQPTTREGTLPCRPTSDSSPSPRSPAARTCPPCRGVVNHNAAGAGAHISVAAGSGAHLQQHVQSVRQAQGPARPATRPAAYAGRPPGLPAQAAQVELIARPQPQQPAGSSVQLLPRPAAGGAQVSPPTYGTAVQFELPEALLIGQLLDKFVDASQKANDKMGIALGHSALSKMLTTVHALIQESSRQAPQSPPPAPAAGPPGYADSTAGQRRTADGDPSADARRRAERGRGRRRWRRTEEHRRGHLRRADGEPDREAQPGPGRPAGPSRVPATDGTRSDQRGSPPGIARRDAAVDARPLVADHADDRPSPRVRSGVSDVAHRRSRGRGRSRAGRSAERVRDRGRGHTSGDRVTPAQI